MIGTSRQSGQALIETILLGLILLIPLLWALGMLADLHRSALAAGSAARDAGEAAAAEIDLQDASLAVDDAVRRAFSDHGLEPGEARVRWAAASGLERGSIIEVEISYPVSVLQAPFLGRVTGPSIWTRARYATRIDPFRSEE